MNAKKIVLAALVISGSVVASAGVAAKAFVLNTGIQGRYA